MTPERAANLRRINAELAALLEANRDARWFPPCAHYREPTPAMSPAEEIARLASYHEHLLDLKRTYRARERERGQAQVLNRRC